MRPRDLILTLVDACSAQPEFGRTSLQKMAFFTARLLRVDLGHRAHYYGPYSDLVEEDVASLVLGGLVREEMTVLSHVSGRPVRKYQYSLTAEGRQRLELIEGRYPEEAARVRNLVERVVAEAGSLDQALLSQAAKTIFVAEATGEPVGFDGLQRVAAEFDWKLDHRQRVPVERLLGALAAG